MHKKIFLLIFVVVSLVAFSCRKRHVRDFSPKANFDALWQILDCKYCFFEEKGIDWDGLKLANLRSEDELENKEALFVNSLIENYEKFLKDAGELSPEHIENLHKFAKTYWSIKAPRQINPRDIAVSAAKKTLEAIAKLALSHKQADVAQWLSENADLIISNVVKNDK